MSRRFLLLAAALLMILMLSVPAYADSPGTIRDLVVDGPFGSQPVGSSATFTASVTADPGCTPEYQFWVHGTDDQWKVAQDYSTVNTYTMENLQPGSYVVAVYCMDESDIAAGNWNKSLYQSFVLNVGSSVDINLPARSRTIVNEPLTVTATAVGLTNPVYQFWYQDPFLQWHGGEYTTDNTFTITPNRVGDYNIVVYAKDPYAPNDYTHSVWSETKFVFALYDEPAVILTAHNVWATPDSPYGDVAAAPVCMNLRDTSGAYINNRDVYVIDFTMTGPGTFMDHDGTRSQTIHRIGTLSYYGDVSMIIYFRPTDQPGTVTVTASVPGFKTGTVSFEYVPPGS